MTRRVRHAVLPRLATAVAAACLLTACAGSGRVVEERWASVYVGGAKVGYFHDTVEETEVEGRPALLTTRELVMLSGGQGAPGRATLDFLETPEGEALRYSHGGESGGVERRLTYRFRPERMQVTQAVGDIEQTSTVPFPITVLGPGGLRRLRAEKGPEPGTAYPANVIWSDLLGMPVRLDHAVKGREEVNVAGHLRTLLRVEVDVRAIPETGDVARQPVAVSKIVWLDDAFREMKAASKTGAGVTTVLWVGREAAIAGVDGPAAQQPPGGPR